VSAEAVQLVEQIQEILTGGDVVSGLEDEEATMRVRLLFERLADSDFEVAMVGPQYLPGPVEYTGFDGFLDAWRDWISPFESYAIELERVIPAGEHVVSLVTMGGTTKMGGPQILTPAAAVWTVVDGRLRRVEFHLDREAALRAAGLEPENY
jgi:ketosteroid isomerase-like protein